MKKILFNLFLFLFINNIFAGGYDRCEAPVYTSCKSGYVLNNGQCINCPDGYVCVGEIKKPCDAGYYCPTKNIDDTKQKECGFGNYCPTASIKPTPCKADYTLTDTSTSKSENECYRKNTLNLNNNLGKCLNYCYVNGNCICKDITSCVEGYYKSTVVQDCIKTERSCYSKKGDIEQHCDGKILNVGNMSYILYPNEITFEPSDDAQSKTLYIQTTDGKKYKGQLLPSGYNDGQHHLHIGDYILNPRLKINN